MILVGLLLCAACGSEEAVMPAVEACGIYANARCDARDRCEAEAGVEPMVPDCRTVALERCCLTLECGDSGEASVSLLEACELEASEAVCFEGRPLIYRDAPSCMVLLR